MELQHKSIVAGDTKDVGDGVVEALVSVTGIVDNVKDIIVPGAYEKTLKDRTPKGVWSHNWESPVSKPLAIKELMPGDPELPKTLANGDPWPAEAGALYVKAQFNLDTNAGREAYSNVKFFEDSAEWSIGYSVPKGQSKTDPRTGIRHIKGLDLFEYSPVLFGAASNARSIVSAVKSMFPEEKDFFEAVKSLDADETPDLETDVDADITDEELVAAVASDDTVLGADDKIVESEPMKLEVEPEAKTVAADSQARVESKSVALHPVMIEQLTKLQAELKTLLDSITTAEVKTEEAPAEVEQKSVEDAMAALVASDLDAKTVEGIDDFVRQFKESIARKENEKIATNATAAIDQIQEALGGDNAAFETDLKVLASAIGTELKSFEAETKTEEEPVVEETVAEEKKLTISPDEYRDLMKINW